MLEVVKTFHLEKRLAMQRTGNALQGSCPTGHPSKSHHSFSIDLSENLYYCFNCGEAGDIVQLVELTEKVGRLEAVRLLISKCAPELNQTVEEWMEKLSPEERGRYERATLYKLTYGEGKRLLYDAIGKPALDYLVQVRGYNPENLQSTDWIYWDTDSNIRSFLLSREPGLREQIKQLPLNGGFGDVFRLAIPFRDRNGLITGFLKRAHERAGFDIGQTTGVRWDSTKGLTKPDLFGLHRIRNQRELVIVEGYPDAVYLPSIGLDNIVACGQAAFSEKYIEGLHAKHITRIILALDNDDGTGIKNSREICRMLSGTDIDVFVIDPPLMGTSKDPDEYVLARGIDAFRNLVDNAERSSTWMARQILTGNNVASDLGKRRAIDEALEFACTLRNPLEAQAVVDTISTQLSLTPEMLDIYYQQLREKTSRNTHSGNLA